MFCLSYISLAMVFVHGVMSDLPSFISVWKMNPTSLNSLYSIKCPCTGTYLSLGPVLDHHSVQLLLGRSLSLYVSVFNIFVLYIWSWNHYTRVKDPEQRPRRAGLYHVHQRIWSASGTCRSCGGTDVYC